MGYPIINPLLTYDEEAFALGTVGFDDVGRGFMFVKADAALSLARICSIELDFGASHASNSNLDINMPAGVVVVAIPSGDHGWLQVYGKGSVRCAALAAAAAGIIPYTDGTAGTIDDTASGNTKYSGVYLGAAALAAGDRPCFLNFPKGSD